MTDGGGGWGPRRGHNGGITGTGFQKNYTLFDDVTRERLNIESDGLYLFRNTVPTNVDNLAFVGSELATISNISTYGIQAAWLAKLWKGEMPAVENKVIHRADCPLNTAADDVISTNMALPYGPLLIFRYLCGNGAHACVFPCWHLLRAQRCDADAAAKRLLIWAGGCGCCPQASMEAEVTAIKAWKRKWMPETSARASLILLHQTHFHDRLMKDMGLPHRRKGMNILAELLMPYTSEDYNGVIGK